MIMELIAVSRNTAPKVNVLNGTFEVSACVAPRAALFWLLPFQDLVLMPPICTLGFVFVFLIKKFIP